MKSPFDYILRDIAQRGLANKEAILAHHSAKAGERGAKHGQAITAAVNGTPKRKSGTQGICRIMRKRVKAHAAPILRPSKDIGTPIKTDGSTGYIRDRITGVITTCVATGNQ